MKVTKEITELREMDWWAGAKDVYQDLLSNPDDYDYIESYLECFEEIDETQLNDWMWFDVPELLEEHHKEEEEENE